MTQLTIREGTTLFYTQVGEYNFHYPDPERETKASDDFKAEELFFIGAPSHRAFRVSNRLFPDAKYNIMWIKRSDL